MRDNRSSTVRRATPADAALIAELGAATFREAFAAFNRPEDLAHYLAKAYGVAQQSAELADPRVTYLIGEAGGRPAGFAMLRRGATDPAVTGPDPVELVRIYVSSAVLGTGLGSALMEACIAEAAHAGHRTLWLGVWEQNPRALAFYHRWGFVDVGSHIFTVGTDPQTDRVMALALP
jgi:ribosomal protein S18 acetylase RimI-like enzyme